MSRSCGNHRGGVCAVGFVLVLQAIGVQLLIIPDELPSILSIVFSNVPTIKKGTDSRLGWGFRLGDRADFQVMVEMGPQTYTQPLANQPDNNEVTNRKRNAEHNLANTLYAQQQHRNRQISNTEGGKWLEKWSDSFKYIDGSGPLPTPTIKPQPRPGLAPGEIDAKSVIPPDSGETEEERLQQSLVLRQLQEDRNPKSLKEDEEAILRFLKLMQRLQKQIEEEEKNRTKDATVDKKHSSSTTEGSDLKITSTTEKGVIRTTTQSSTVSTKKTSAPDTSETKVASSIKISSNVGENQKAFVVSSERPSTKSIPNDITKSGSTNYPKTTTEKSTKTNQQTEKRTPQNAIKATSRSISNQRTDIPLPNETFFEFLLRRMGYYEYLREQKAKQQPRKFVEDKPPSKNSTVVGNGSAEAKGQVVGQSKNSTVLEGGSQTVASSQ